MDEGLSREKHTEMWKAVPGAISAWQTSLRKNEVSQKGHSFHSILFIPVGRANFPEINLGETIPFLV